MKLTCSHAITKKPVADDYVMHAHDSYEIFCLCSGNASYYVEGTEYPLHHGDIVLMRKNESHHLILHSEEDYERYVINFLLPDTTEFDYENRLLKPFDDRELGQFNHYDSYSFPDNHWVYYLKKIIGTEQVVLRFSYLLALLAELSECFEEIKNSGHRNQDDIISRIIRFINEHIYEDLSLDFICERFYISKVHLNRLFKKRTGATVWRYITVKRLLLARDMLEMGENPMDVSIRCGFRDYTTFFRAYKKQFSASPKDDKKR